MKKNLTKFLAAIALLVFMAPSMVGWGQTRSEVTYTFSQHYNANTTLTDVAIEFDNNITGTFHKGTGSTAPQYYTNGTAVRWYGGNTLDITASNATISAIELTYTQKNKTVTTDVGTYNHNTGTWTGSASSVTFTVESGSGHNRVSVIKVTYAVAGGNESVSTPNISPNGGAFLDSQEVTITCATDGATIYYTTNGNDPTTSSSVYSAPFTINATTTVKAFAVKSGLDNSAIASATFTKVIPMTVAEARAAIDAGTGTQDVYVTGTVSGIVEAWSTGYSNISFNMSDDGLTTSDQLEAFRCVSTDNADASEVGIGDVVVVHGNLTLYNNTTYEFTSGCQLVSLEHPATIVATPTFNPNGGTFTEAQTVTISCETQGATIYYTTDGTDPDDESTLYEGPITVGESMTVKAIAYDNNDNASAIASATFTINLPYSGAPYARVNNVSYLTDGAKVIFAARFDGNANQYYAMTAAATGKPTGVLFTSTTSNDLEVLPAAIVNSESTYCWTVGVTSNSYTFTNANGQVIGYTSGTNFAIGGDNTEWTVALGTSGESAMVPNYDAFNITNYNQNGRGFALNNQHNYGPYAVSNNNSSDYNFFIDIFVQGAEPVAIPSITANNVAIEYDVTSGSIAYSITNEPSPAGTMTAAIAEGGTIANLSLGTITNGTIPFTCDANMSGASRTATVTLTYTYNRETVTRDVTITQAANPNYIMTIAEVRALSAGTTVTTKGIVTSCVGTTGYIQDATAAICVFGANLTVGDEIKVTGPLTNYNGLLEIGSTSTAATVDEIISQNNTVNPELMTIAEINASTNQGWYVRIEDATVTAISGQNTTITQGENTIVVRGITGVEYEVNDIISLNGNIGYYNANQIANPQNVTVQQNTEPTITITEATINMPAAGGTGTIEVTYLNFDEIEPEAQFFEADGTTSATYDWITVEFDEDYNAVYTVEANDGEARTAYFKVYEANGYYSNLVTVNQAQYVIDYAELPFEFDGGKADIDTTNGLTQNGLGGDYGSSPKLKFDGTDDWVILHFIEEPGELSFDIKGNTFSGGTFTVQTSVDGETYTDLASYTELGNTQHETFNNLASDVRYIKWIYTEKVSGNVALGNITLAEYTAPQQYTLTIGDPEHITITATYDGNEILTNAEEADILSGTEITLFLTIEEGYVLDELTVVNAEQQPVTLTPVASTENTWTFTMPNSNVTVNATAVEEPVVTNSTYTLATGIESGKTYIIVGWADSAPYAMGEQRSNNRAGVGITVDGTTATVSSEVDVYEFVVASLGEGYYSIYDEVTPGYLYAASGGNYLRTEAQLDEDHNGEWKITIDSETGLASVVADQSSNRNVMQFNNGSKIFSCYASASQHPVYFYEKVDVVTETIYLPISGYGTSDGGYHLIATPIDGIDPANVTNMTNGTFDLYMFDQSGDQYGNEWINYEQGNNQFGFNELVAGMGYLYAHDTDTTLIFTGTPVAGDSYEVSLVLDEDSEFPGWNLVGNSFNEDAYIDCDYYVMNEDGDKFIEQGKEIAIARLQGIFVIAEADGDELTFTKAATEPEKKVVMNVTSDRNNLVDRATIRFGEGRQLPKFMFNPDDTKLYIPQYEEEYAVVRSEYEAETPVSFKAATNGTYTISFSTDEVEMEYMHLIDNLTGADIDLLATPSYTFEASTTDYANRFNLVYGVLTGVNENKANHFAFFNGSNWTVNNEGEATLQIVDLTGRVLSTETLSGNANINIDQAAGVYMLRLINGENVMTQKVVVR